MRVLCVAAAGGHIEQMMVCLDAFAGHEVVFAHYDWPSFRDFSDRRVSRHVGIFLGGDGDDKMRLLVGMILSAFQWVWLLAWFRPHVVFSTGAEVAIVPIVLGKLFRRRTIFLETAARMQNPSGTGKVVYRFCDAFFVQSEAMLTVYGPKARFVGGLL